MFSTPWGWYLEHRAPSLPLRMSLVSTSVNDSIKGDETWRIPLLLPVVVPHDLGGGTNTTSIKLTSFQLFQLGMNKLPIVTLEAKLFPSLHQIRKPIWYKHLGIIMLASFFEQSLGTLWKMNLIQSFVCKVLGTNAIQCSSAGASGVCAASYSGKEVTRASFWYENISSLFMGLGCGYTAS